MTDGREEVTDSKDTGYLTDIDQRLLNLCAANGLKVDGSLFWLKNIHKGTWRIQLQVRLRGTRQPMHGGILAAAQPCRCAA